MSTFFSKHLVVLGAPALLLSGLCMAGEPGVDAAGLDAVMPVVELDSPGPPTPVAPMPPHIARQGAGSVLGVRAVEPDRLARQRGAADVVNDMQLKGVVSNNQAVNVATGNNAIADGSFAHSSGIPMVVQNSGNNVLIQNATIVNVQVK